MNGPFVYDMSSLSNYNVRKLSLMTTESVRQLFMTQFNQNLVYGCNDNAAVPTYDDNEARLLSSS